MAELGRAFIKADNGALCIGGSGVELEDVFHARAVFAVHLWNAPHVLAPRPRFRPSGGARSRKRCCHARSVEPVHRPTAPGSNGHAQPVDPNTRSPPAGPLLCPT